MYVYKYYTLIKYMTDVKYSNFRGFIFDNKIPYFITRI